MEHSFCVQFVCRLTKGPDQGTFGRTRGLQMPRLISIIQDFWRSSEAVGLSQVTCSKMLRQLTGQISAHYSSSKIRNTHLRFLSSGPRATYCTAIPNFAQKPGLSQVTCSKMLRQLTGQISAHYSSSKIRNPHLRFFRLDQGPHTVQQYPISHKNPSIITCRMKKVDSLFLVCTLNVSIIV